MHLNGPSHETRQVDFESFISVFHDRGWRDAFFESRFLPQNHAALSSSSSRTGAGKRGVRDSPGGTVIDSEMYAFGGLGDHCIVDCRVSRECLSFSAPGDTSGVADGSFVAFTVAGSLCFVGLLAYETLREGVVNLRSIFQCDLRTLHTAGRLR